jgi:hypothetical protein
MGTKTFVVTLLLSGLWFASIPLAAIAIIWSIEIPVIAFQIWATIGLLVFVAFLLFGAIMNFMEQDT